MSTAGRAVGSAVAVVLTSMFAAIVLSIVRSRATDHTVKGDDDASAGEAARESPRASAMAASPARERDAASETVASGQDQVEAAASTDEKLVRMIDGVVILLDAKGNEHVDADGEMVTLEDNRYGAPPESVPITKGRFRVSIRDGHRLHIHGIKLDGTLVRPDREEIRSSDGPVVTLRVLASRPFLLHCVDAVSRAELTGVTLGEDDDDQIGEIARDQALVYCASSPIRIDATPDLDRVPWSLNLRALAPGYAACHVVTDFRFGGEVFLPMSRAAGLRVTATGAPQDALLRLVRKEVLPHQAALSLRPERDFDLEWARGVIEVKRLESSEPVLFPLLPSGDYDVSIAPADDPLSPTPLVHQSLTLAAGKTEEITLACPEYQVDAPVSISGTIEVPSGWDDAPFQLGVFRSSKAVWWCDHRLVPSNVMAREEGDPRIYRWSARGIHPATYAVAINELGCGGQWSIGPEGRSDLRIVVQPCARVTFHVIDVATEEAVDWYCVEWMPDAADGLAGACIVGSGDEPRAFAGRVPVGRGNLEDLHDMQIVESDPIEIRPGSNEVTRHVRPLPGVRLELACEEWRVPWPVGERCQVIAVDHDGKVVDEKNDAEDDRLLLVSESGRYRITLPAVFGFNRAAELDLEIPDGDPGIRKVELKRRQ